MYYLLKEFVLALWNVCKVCWPHLVALFKAFVVGQKPQAAVAAPVVVAAPPTTPVAN